jgi:hypothetical protein
MKYRTYDHAFNRTGYSAEPQYPGQQPIRGDTDYPAACSCGATMARWTWKDAHCANGHEMVREPVIG